MIKARVRIYYYFDQSSISNLVSVFQLGRVFLLENCLPYISHKMLHYLCLFVNILLHILHLLNYECKQQSFMTNCPTFLMTFPVCTFSLMFVLYYKKQLKLLCFRFVCLTHFFFCCLDCLSYYIIHCCVQKKDQKSSRDFMSYIP